MKVLKAGRFYGETYSRRSAGATLSLVYHRHRREVPAHVHACAYFCLLLEGQYEETCAALRIEYDPLTLVFHPSRTLHTDIVGAESRMFTLELETQWDPAIAALRLPESPLFSLSGAAPLWSMLRLYELFRSNTLNELSTESLCFELLSYVYQLETQALERQPAWLESVRAMLDERYRERLNLSDLAKTAGVHPGHLARAFREAFKTTVGDYVARRRIQRACRLLTETERAISDIAADLGFVDQSHFHRVFRSLVGRTPASFRHAGESPHPTG